MMSKTFTCLLVFLVAQLAAVSLAASFERRQGLNTLYQQYPKLMTSAVNSTTNVIPISRALAQTLVGSRKLLTPTGLPAGFLKADEHVLVIHDTLSTDVRQNVGIDLRVDSLLIMSAIIPFVDGSGNGKSPFSFYAASWTDQLVPALVATLVGQKYTLSHFEPSKAAYSQIANNQFLQQVFTGLDNPLDGPGLLTPVYQSRFSAAPRGKLSAKVFRDLISQPVLRPNGKCDKVIHKFDEPFAAPFFAKADVQLGKAITGTPMTFNGVESWCTSYGWAAPAGSGSDCKTLV